MSHDEHSFPKPPADAGQRSLPSRVDRRRFLLLAAASGTLAATHSLLEASPAEAAKGNRLPRARKNKDRIPVDIVPEVGESVSGTLDMTTIARSKSPTGVDQISFELHFDRYEEGKSVRETTDKIEKLALVHQELHRPPTALLTWGTGLAFKCVLESFTLRFTAFRAEPDGTPQAIVPLGAVMRTTFQVIEG